MVLALGSGRGSVWCYHEAVLFPFVRPADTLLELDAEMQLEQRSGRPSVLSKGSQASTYVYQATDTARRRSMVP